MSTELVYVLGTPGSNTVKIGRTTNLAKRVADIQRMSPVLLQALWTHPGGHELETGLHRHFKARRSHGEWFVFDSDPVEAVRSAVEKEPWVKVAPAPRSAEPVSPPAKKMSADEFAAMLASAELVREAAPPEFQEFDEAVRIAFSELQAIEDPKDRYHAVRNTRQELAEVERAALALERNTVIDLKGTGLTWKQVGQLLGVSGARAEQIAKAA
ncbi:GIY-YIG nuclease family protein [Streptomyces europaeiscabiei]|uniref:GIY-YIG nuclease family protein n=1 Tax=Streptomyces europaeiscabiei TaxID=146819 RepID=UPI0029BF328F|nr:GIY-YIG nuclease family protein [Streptomyces europaeiscabiei]MDX3585996.1 GIY-YIG nuclease family protein [Streptomyces europaeiscabiei]MDX3839594.1 GIY-YIG nuclease family protein [Streptomyces europaeiscabiei]